MELSRLRWIMGLTPLREEQTCAIGVRSCRSPVLPPRGHPGAPPSSTPQGRDALAKGGSKQKLPQSGSFPDIKAEGERFELSDDVTAVNSFRDRVEMAAIPYGSCHVRLGGMRGK